MRKKITLIVSTLLFVLLEGGSSFLYSSVHHTLLSSITIDSNSSASKNNKELINPKQSSLIKSKKKISYLFMYDLITFFVFTILVVVIFIQYFKRKKIKQNYEEKFEAIKTAYSRLKESNNNLEEKIKSRTEEVIDQINEQDSILIQLSQSQKRFEQIFSKNSDALVIVDYDTLFIHDINQVAIIFFKLKTPVKRSYHFLELRSENSTFLILKIAVIIKNHQEVLDYVISQNLSNNIQKWFSLTSQIITFDEKRYFFIGLKNITKRKKAEISLSENEKRLKLLTENINDMIWLMDENLHITYVSPSILSNLGYHPEEAINQSIAFFLQHSSYVKIRDLIQNNLQKAETKSILTLELEFISKSGKVRIEEFKTKFIVSSYNRILIYGVSRDISEKKKTEIELKKSEQLYRLITSNVNDVIFTSDTSLNIKYVNKAISSFLNYSPEDLVNQSLSKFLSTDGYEKLNKELTTFFNEIYEANVIEKKSVFDDVLDFITKQGTNKWGKVHINLLIDEKNYIYGLVGTIQDFSHKHQIAAFEESTNNFFKKLFYDSPVMMVIVDKNGFVININNSFIEKTGYSHNFIFNRPLSSIFIDSIKNEFSDSSEKNSEISKLKTAENTLLDILYDYESINITNEAKKFLIVMRDITNQLKAEKSALIQQEQFKALSENSPDIIARFNSNLECIYINPTVEKELEIEPKNFLNQTLTSLELDLKEISVLNDHFIQVFINGSEEVVDFSLTIHGVKKYFQSRIIPEFNESNIVETIMVVTRNMSEYTKAIEMLHENVHQTKLLNKAIMFCNQSKTKKELYKNILPLIIDFMGFDGGGIYEFNETKNTAILHHEVGLSNLFTNSNFQLTPSNPFFEEVFVIKKIVNFFTSEAEPNLKKWLDNFEIKTVYITPIINNNKIIGSLNLKSNSYVEVTPLFEETLRIIMQEFGSSIDKIEAISLKIESEENYRSLVETTTDLVWKVNEFLVYNFVNHKCMDLLGYTPEEILGTSLISTIALEEHIKIKKFLELNKTLLEKFTLVDVPLIKKSGQIIHVEINGYPLIDSFGRFIGYAGINRDISIRKINEDLRQRKEVAERMAQIKQEFVSNISHELRTPLTAIMGHTEIINSKIDDIEISSHLRTIESNSKSLLSLINDILDVSKIEAGKLDLQKEPINIFKFFDDINLTFSPLAKSKSIDFFLEIDKANIGSLIIDELRLKQIVYNVVANAIKFTNYGYVKLIINLLNYNTEQRAIDMVISVIDTGIGVDEQLANNIFDSYTQAYGQNNKKYGGSGLGLSICKNLIELMDGSISFESKKGIGSTFRIILPSIEMSYQKAKNDYFNPLLVDKKIAVIEKSEVLSSNIHRILDQSECYIMHVTPEELRELNTDSVDFIFIYYKEVQEDFELITNLLLSVKIKTIVVYDNQKKECVFENSLTLPIDFQKMNDLLLLVISKQFAEDEGVNFSNIEAEIKKWTAETKQIVMDSLTQNCTHLWTKATTNNSIDQITLFEKNIYKIAKKNNIKFLKQYAMEINISLKTFDIEKLKILLDIFPKIIRYLKNIKEDSL